MIDSPDKPQVPPTAPVSFNIQIADGCFVDEARAKSFAQLLGAIIQEFSRTIDLSSLDGVTVTTDLRGALNTLDRGYETEYQLVPSRSQTYGVAMTPGVLRNGQHKSHMVFDLNFLIALEDSSHKNFGFAAHLLAHECAHVEVTAAFDRCFPGMLLRQKLPSHNGRRLAIAMSCWDEYAVTRLVAEYGRDPLNDYQTSFLQYLLCAADEAEKAVDRYWSHRDLGLVLNEISAIYGQLLKLAAYLLGTMDGSGKTVGDLPDLDAALIKHDFEAHFLTLRQLLQALMQDYGSWPTMEAFYSIADLADAIVEDAGVSVRPTEDGGSWVEVRSV